MRALSVASEGGGIRSTTLNFSENSTALDADGDFIFSANNINDEIRVIRDQSSICS